MEIVRKNGDDFECRIENVICINTGAVAVLSGSPDIGYKVLRWTTLDELEKNHPEDWSVIYKSSQDSDENYIAEVGETSYGGAGFILLRDKKANEVIWVVHLNECNNFEWVKIDNNLVIAKSDYHHPRGTKFTISIESPKSIEVMKL